MLLVLDCSIRKESRTKFLASKLIEKFTDEVNYISLTKLGLKPLDEEMLKFRDNAIFNNDYSDSYFDLAKEFLKADNIVIIAPYYDLSFPALLKLYIENIMISGLTFKYQNNMPVGFSKCKKCYYVTTSGGYIINEDYFYGYIKDVFKNMLGVKDFELIKAEGLDIYGNNTDTILEDAINNIK